MELAFGILALLILLPLMPEIRLFVKGLMDDINGKPKGK